MDKALISAAEYLQQMLSKIEADVVSIKHMLSGKKDDSFLEQWIPMSKVQSILCISRKQLFILRKKGIIGYHQVGRKIFISRKSLTAFMEQNFIKAEF